MSAITSGKDVIAAIKAGAELWHISDSPLPGHWELRRARQPIQRVHWDAIEIIRRHYLPWFEANTVYSEEGRYNTGCYQFKQRSLAGLA
ncbi:hypothetical protein [uncultured Devosia sp.]|uniref:hypothetical protein n=1 Tax=uncultured Devosia sp. TaxID=211434 RepID=UPI0026037B17|nr:hypothetical protein [uncultured Devosia sp.]